MLRPLPLTLLCLAFLLPSVLGARPAAPGAAAASEPGGATAAWDRVLHRFGHDGGLDYAGLAADRADLDSYLASLDAVRPDELSEKARLAFWINAYNAVVVGHVLERYPGIESVKKVDGFFDALTFPVAGEPRTLDAIEKQARSMGDPRVHFAVVCASVSCPDLRGEAYVPQRLDEQLEDQTRSFLGNPEKGLRYDPGDDVLWLSSIFKWYAGDFTGGSTIVAFFARGKVVDWVRPHVPPELARTLEKRDPSVRYLDYDWNLNDRP